MELYTYMYLEGLCPEPPITSCCYSFSSKAYIEASVICRYQTDEDGINGTAYRAPLGFKAVFLWSLGALGRSSEFSVGRHEQLRMA